MDGQKKLSKSGYAMASILLITPDRALDDYVMQVLLTEGHQVIRAGVAEEAGGAAVTLPVDVVVADIVSSDLPDARDRLEATGRRVAFVFVSPLERFTDEGLAWTPEEARTVDSRRRGYGGRRVRHGYWAKRGAVEQPDTGGQASLPRSRGRKP